MADSKKKVLFIIAPRDFRDEEYFQPRVIMVSTGLVTMTTALTSEEEATGLLGGKAKIDVRFNRVKCSNYDAIVFVGGAGAKTYFTNDLVLKLVKEADRQKKVLAAICIAPSILANAGVLVGKKATSFPTQKNNLIAKKAVWCDDGVVIDGRLITARGPEFAVEFGQAVVKLLKQ